MDCCYDDCGEYAVTPILVAANCPSKCYEEGPTCYPSLPRCPKPVYYVCEKKVHKSARAPVEEECCQHHHHQPRHSAPRCISPVRREPCPAPVQCCKTCGQPSCKPVKTKYIIPCYRYEDGRITNQPTVLTRRACEVACGTRARRKPFICSSYTADPYKEVRRFHSEDERGNCCYHFEKRKPTQVTYSPCVPSPTPTCQPCVSSPECQYTDCVYARPVASPSCCYYCK